MSSRNKYLGIEIGGTKLQLGVGTAQTQELDELVRADVEVAAGAEGIFAQIERAGRSLIEKHEIAAVGVGFGGPVDARSGRVFKSHQIEGWDDFPLGNRLRQAFGLPFRIDNDCNAAALGEAKLGAGQGVSRVFYVTVGTGIGGGFVIDGKLDGNHRPAISEIGHLRPGTSARSSEHTVESMASGWGISNWTRDQLKQSANDNSKQRLLELCDGHVNLLATKQIGLAALEGNILATAAIGRATNALGWAIAQVVTLLAPELVVVGGGVSLIGETFFSSLGRHTNQYVFAPLVDSYSIVPAALGEEVVIHGALQLVTV